MLAKRAPRCIKRTAALARTHGNLEEETTIQNRDNVVSPVATAVFLSNLLKRRWNPRAIIITLASIIFFAGIINPRWSWMEKTIQVRNYRLRGNGARTAVWSGTVEDEVLKSQMTRAAAVNAARKPMDSSALPLPLDIIDAVNSTTSVSSTTLLVAIGDGLEGKAALVLWSDFVSCARTPTAAASMEQEEDKSWVCGRAGGELELDRGRGRHGRRNEEGRWLKERDPSQSFFPPVWIITSDPEVDREIREGMPHLSSFFVPGILGKGAADGGTLSGEGLSSWSGILDRFLSLNRGVKVFGIFGEGAIPTATLLPHFMSSDAARDDAPSARPDAADAPADNYGTGGVAHNCGSGYNTGGGGCAIESALWPILSKSPRPTAVLSRAREWWNDANENEAKRGLDGSRGRTGDWMPDKVVTQVWCNRDMLTTFMRKNRGLSTRESAGGTRLKFLHVIQWLLRESRAGETLLIDGTKAAPARYLCPPAAPEMEDNVVGGKFEQNESSEKFVALKELVNERRKQEEERRRRQQPGNLFATFTPTTPRPVLGYPRRQALPEVDFYIGALDLALGFEVVDGGHDIQDDGNKRDGVGVWKVVRPPWPREYVLETVSQSPFHSAVGDVDGQQESGSQEGLVVVTSVNCGYIDFAVNFLLSVWRVAEHVKVLFVATDQVSFDFFDALSPGHAALLPLEGLEAPHAVEAGVFGDKTFELQTLPRPGILLSILEQGYRVLWIDADTVWLGNVLPMLPNPRRSKTNVAEVVVLPDASMTCTCFIYLDCTSNTIRLMELWKEEILDSSVHHDQIAFQNPLGRMVDDGLRLETLPEEVMPPGKRIFNQNISESKYELYRQNMLVVHNNWVLGHDSKLARFRESNLWMVDDGVLPKC